MTFARWCVALALATAVLAWGAPSAHAYDPWHDVGGSLNNAAGVAAADGGMTVIGTTPYVAWTEASVVRVRSWDGANWNIIGVKVNGAGNGAQPAIGNDGTNPWVAYTEVTGGFTNVYVRKLVAGVWTLQGGSLNIAGGANATNPRITFNGALPTVVWEEMNGGVQKLYSRSWTGAAWTAALGGGALNADVTRVANVGEAAYNGANLWVAVQQWNGTAWQIQARMWNGVAWATQGAALNLVATENSYAPSIAIDAGVPYITFGEYNGTDQGLYVKKYVAGVWSLVGTRMNPYWVQNQHIRFSGGVPYVTSTEYYGSNYTTRLYQWTGTQWIQLGGPANHDVTANSAISFVDFVSGEPWVTYTEPVATFDQVYVRRYNANNGMVSNITGWTATAYPGQVDLAWTNPGDATFSGVKIYRSTVQGTLGSLVKTVLKTDAPNNSWSDTGRVNGTTLYYTLVAYNSANDERETTYDTGTGFQNPNLYAVGVAGNGSKLWTFGGCIGGGTCIVRTDVWEYDATTDQLTQKAATLPTGRIDTAAAYVGGSVNRAFIFGGDDGTVVLNNVLKYDPVGDTVVAAGTIPGARRAGGVVYAPNTDRIYYIGGTNKPETVFYNTIYAYNPNNGTSVDTGVLLPQAMDRLNATVYWPADGCIYMFGGMTTGAVNSNKIVKFCPMTGTAVNLTTTMPAARSELTAYVGADDITIVGSGAGGTYYPTIWSFVPSTGSLLQHPMVMPMGQVGKSPGMMLGTGDRGFMVSRYPRTNKVLQINAGAIAAATPSAPPTTPTNVAPASGVGVATGTPTLTASAFNDPGDTHAASQWQVRTNAGSYAAPAYDSGIDPVNLTSDGVSPSLADGTYWFQVRYRDNNGVWSNWSAETMFFVDTQAPTAPTLVTPLDTALVGTKPPLTATYNDPAPGSTGTLVFQICTNVTCGAVAQTSPGVSTAVGANGTWTTGVALANGTYWWRARATDAAGTVGPWSVIRSMNVVAIGVTSATPNSLPEGRQGQTVQITGTGFQNGATVTFSGIDVAVASTTWMSATRIDVVLNISTAGVPGLRNITVTNPDTLSATANNAFTVTASTLTMNLSTLGYADAARTPSPGPYTVAWGLMLPGTTRSIGTAGSGQTRVGESAVDVSITSDTDYVVQASSTNWSDGTHSMAPGVMAWKHHSVAEAFTPFTLAASTVEGPSTTTPTTYSYDWQLTMPGGQGPGAYTASVTYTIVPAF